MGAEKARILEIIDDKMLVVRSRAIVCEDRKKFNQMLGWEMVLESLRMLKGAIEGEV